MATEVIAIVNTEEGGKRGSHPFYGQFYTHTHTHTHAVFPSQRNVITWQLKNIFHFGRYNLSIVDDFSILNRNK